MLTSAEVCLTCVTQAILICGRRSKKSLRQSIMCNIGLQSATPHRNDQLILRFAFPTRLSKRLVFFGWRPGLVNFPWLHFNNYSIL